MKQPETALPCIVPLSESALTIEFGETIDLHTNESVLAFATAVERAGLPGFLEVVPTYRSATVYFDPFRTDVSTMTGHFRALMTTTNTPPRAPATHTVPVWYGGSAGPDLSDVAKRAALIPEQVSALHASVLYRVYMLGFSPGFPYLGTVPDRIATPRLPTPRKHVAAGSVGIAGTQTGIYPHAGPGGWRIIGRTPVPLFSLSRPAPFLLAPGDQVQFVPIGETEFHALFENHT